MAMKARYTVINGEIIAEKRNGVRNLYVPDSLGSTVALLDNTQTQTDTFAYWPYGEDAGRTGSTPTPFRYTGIWGCYRNSNSSNYVRARTLDTQKGRWLTEDPIGFAGHDWNIYRYVQSNSVTFFDPTGTDVFSHRPPPYYNPDPWGGDKRIQNNCFSYAGNCPSGHSPKDSQVIDDKNDGKRFLPQPGKGIKGGKPNRDCQSIINNLLRIGWILPPDRWSLVGYGNCPPGYHRTWLFTTAPEADFSYHFFRQDADGTWSQKEGANYCTNKDIHNENRPIFYPPSAYHQPYIIDCGVICAPN